MASTICAPDGHQGIEGGHRFLEHYRNGRLPQAYAGLRQGRQVGSVETDGSDEIGAGRGQTADLALDVHGVGRRTGFLIFPRV